MVLQRAGDTAYEQRNRKACQKRRRERWEIFLRALTYFTPRRTILEVFRKIRKPVLRPGVLFTARMLRLLFICRRFSCLGLSAKKQESGTEGFHISLCQLPTT